MKPVRVTNGKCTIVGSAALPELPGGSDSICRTIAAAIRAQAPSVHYSVEVTVVSASRLSADLIVEGKKLPQQRFAVMDRGLGEGSLARFAQSLARVVAEAAKQ